MKLRIQLAGGTIKEDDPLFEDDPVWAAHQAVLDRARREAEARMN